MGKYVVYLFKRKKSTNTSGHFTIHYFLQFDQ